MVSFWGGPWDLVWEQRQSEPYLLFWRRWWRRRRCCCCCCCCLTMMMLLSYCWTAPAGTGAGWDGRIVLLLDRLQHVEKTAHSYETKIISTRSNMTKEMASYSALYRRSGLLPPSCHNFHIDLASLGDYIIFISTSLRSVIPPILICRVR